MPESIRDDSHRVLQLLASKGPNGLFYPRVDGDRLGLDRDRLDAVLDQLRLGGFVEIGDWTAASGQGYRLTETGAAAVGQPALLTRPRQPQVIQVPADKWDQADEIRRAVLTPPRPIVTQTLLAINVALFVFSTIYLMQQGVEFNDVVNGRAVVRTKLDRNLGFPVSIPGELSSPQFFDGGWWRLFTYMFLHNGLIHIASNMFCLYTLGNVLEGRWGWKRFLVVYLGSGLTGGIGVLVGSAPNVHVVGASGAICGLLTSIGVWAWMYREYLPPHFVEAHYRMVGINLMIMVAISVGLPNISLAGHVGGAIGGAALSVPLAWMGPASPPQRRVVGAISLIVIAAACAVIVVVASMRFR